MLGFIICPNLIVNFCFRPDLVFFHLPEQTIFNPVIDPLTRFNKVKQKAKIPVFKFVVKIELFNIPVFFS